MLKILDQDESVDSHGSPGPNFSTIDCGIKSLKDIPLQLNTVSLNLHSNCIQKMENLQFLQQLVHLDLSSNQIKKIDGIQGLVSLQSLNLSCNSIICIENLDGLKALRLLDLSYNKIQYINGLSDLWSTDYSIETILLNGNFLSSIEELTYYLNGLVKLKNITLNNNKFLHNVDYRVVIFANSKSLVSIDGRDKANREVKFNRGASNTLNQFQEFIDWNKSFEDTVKFTTKYPKLSQSKKGTSQIKKCNKDSNHNSSNNSQNNTTYLSKEVNEMLLNNQDINVIEDKIHKLLSLRNRFKQTNQAANKSNPKRRTLSTTSSSSSDIEDTLNLSTSSTPNMLKKFNTTRVKNPKFTSQSDLAKCNGAHVKSILKPTNVTIGDNSSIKTADSSANSNLTENTLCNSQTSLNSENQNGKKEFIGLMQTQLDTYKKSTELNIQLITDLRTKLETLTLEKEKSCSEKDALTKSLTETNTLLNTQLTELKLKNEGLETRVKDLVSAQLSKPSEVDKIDTMKQKLKKAFHSEIDRLKKAHETECHELREKLTDSQAALKSVENEFRDALIIESNRHNELFVKYETINKEASQLKTRYAQLEQSDERNKSLIKELNELIKEQKSRLQTLTKLRKETSDNMQSRADKLSEAVADCTKLKSQLDDLKREKLKVDSQLKIVAVKYKEIEQEKFTWSQKLNDQKSLLMQEMSRLNVENQTNTSELEQVQKRLARELDDVKIKAKIIEDQTETIKKLKQGLIERDSLVKEHRDETLKTQKSLEKQLNEEMDHTNELQMKLEKVNERKENLKDECARLQESLSETKDAYEELTTKWKQKSTLITDLDLKVRKMKENYEAKERALLEETKTLREESICLNERLRKIDDNFRKQYDVEKREHLKLVERTRHEYEVKLKISDEKVQATEQEMRQILKESAQKKKFYEEKIKSFTSAFQNIQADFEIPNKDLK